MMAMLPKRRLGNTGLEVSILGFGASPLGNIYSDVSEQAGIESVHEAFKQGINFFDTSPYYGNTRSELVLGKALQALPRDQIVVATKCGRYGADCFDFSAERVTASVLESLQRLQLGYVDLMQVHDMEFGSLDQVVQETLPALQRLKQQELIRHIGITGLPLKAFRYVLERVQPGTVDSILSYCHYTLFDHTLEDLVPYLKDKGIGIINASVLSMGLLTNRGPPDWHPAPPEVKAACRQAAQTAAERGTDISRLALMDAVKNPNVASHLVGMTSPAEVRSDVQTVLEALQMVPSRATAGEAEAASEVQNILQLVQGATWPSGLPENN